MDTDDIGPAVETDDNSPAMETDDKGPAVPTKMIMVQQCKQIKA